jgi:hypothetical protein
VSAFEIRAITVPRAGAGTADQIGNATLAARQAASMSGPEEDGALATLSLKLEAEKESNLAPPTASWASPAIQFFAIRVGGKDPFGWVRSATIVAS